MALSQSDRISLSKKIVRIPSQNKTADDIKIILEENRLKALDEDNANKSLMDSNTSLINPYQKELSSYDANERTELVEQDLIDGSDHKFKNFFFPNDINTALPSSPDGVWKNFSPSGYSKAIGRNYLEVFPSIVTKEQDKIDALLTAITNVELLSDGVRSSGQECAADSTGACAGGVPPGATDEATCLLNGGVWTPTGGPDTYSPSAAAISALSDLQTAIDDWQSFILSTKLLVQAENAVDTNSTRTAQNNISIADIDNSNSIINNWNANPDFDTTTTLPSGSLGSGCTLFDAMVFSDFIPSKLRSPEMQFIKDELVARQVYIPIRVSEITSNLGSVVQAVDGVVTTANGFYGSRFRIINLRLNLMGGSLNKLRGAESGKNAQDQLKASNDNAAIAYSTVLEVSQFRAPASGTGLIHILDASNFSVGDSVFVTANSQLEIASTIVSINGNAVTLADSIPKKYRQNDLARLYKEL